jgi:DNA helicase-2/ATP-dependent DNA helicase PcrA
MTLTPQQNEAVHTPHHDTLVIAGAGSGKTRVLTERVRYLLEQGASASELLVLTFTRKAAGELIGRLRARIATDPAEADRLLAGMLIGTFHSVALKIIRTEGHILGYRPDSLTVLPVVDADELLRQVHEDMGHCRGKKWKSPFSWQRANEYRDSHYTQRKLPWLDALSMVHENAFVAAYSEYMMRCRELNAMDFGQLLWYTNRLFTDYPAVLERYQRQIKHVLVDELQDSDEVQYNLHDHFAPPGSFFGVGDTRQSIYGFRGARPDLMVGRHPDATVINLTDCFRCGNTIVDGANNLIAINNEPLAEPMVGATKRHGQIIHTNGRSEELMVEHVMGFQGYGYSLSDIVVLARTHRTLRRLQAVCIEENIPHHRVGGNFEICESQEFLLVHAAMRLCANPLDNLAFMHLVRSFGLSSKQYAEIRAYASKTRQSHLVAYIAQRELKDGPMIPVAAAARVINDRSGGYIAIMCDIKTTVYLDEFCDALFPEETPLTPLVVKFWTHNCGNMTLIDALAWYSLRDSQDDIPTGEHLTLMTVHAAKGLEWPVVVVAEMQEGTFPSSRSFRVEGGIEEERRLAYVAMTRASERLLLHYRRPEDQNQDRKITQPSRFIQETRSAP